MAGFNSPGILFLNTWDAPERKYVRTISRRLRESGQFQRVLEPCTGSFVMPSVQVESGWPPSVLETSDVSLFSSIVGYCLTDQPLEELGMQVDKKPVKLRGVNVLEDAATMLWAQIKCRLECKPDVWYWREIVRDLELRKEKHVGGIMDSLAKLRQRLHGMSYRPLDLWRHIEEAAGDPAAIVHLNPPTYKAGFERFFDTKGRITWNEPEYAVFDPAADQERMLQAARDMKCLLICMQQEAPGKCVAPPIYARDLGKGQVVYLWANHPDRIPGWSAVQRSGHAPKKLDHPIIAPDYRITKDSTIALDRISSADSPYYKDLWIHRIEPKQAGHEFAVYVDGYLAGIAGYDTRALNKIGYAHDQGRDALILSYAVAAPHKDRLTRLVTMLAVTRYAVDRFVNPWCAVLAHQVVTVEMSRYPEAKGLRQIMRLDLRKKEKGRYRLVYVADVIERSPQETLKEWLKLEQQWQSRRARSTSVAASTSSG